MKISPIASGPNTVAGVTTGTDPQVSRVDKVRSLKMTTNATPPHLLSPVEPDGVQESATLDPNEANATVEATQPLSPQFAELAKRRRALQVKERELVDREKALLTKSQGRDSVEVARLKSEPLSVLLENGVTFDQLTEAILAGQADPKIAAIEAKVKAMEEGVDKRFKDREVQAEQQALAQMRKEATLLASQGEDYELVRETRSIPDVMKLIERTYRESGEVLETKEALRLVEEYLFDEAKKLASVGKVKSQLVPEAQPQIRPQGMRTLTNKDTASVPMSPKQRALAAFYGHHLKK